jgi:hypothetical protein
VTGIGEPPPATGEGTIDKENEMKRKAVVSILLAGLVGAAALTTTAPASAAKKKAGPVVVGEDPVGDWGAAVDPTIAPVGDALGQDLIGASIGMNGADAIDFVIQLNSLPATGGVPEISRYVWDLQVDGKGVQLDGKFTNYSRGACDPTSGQCPPPRDPGMQPFVVRGNCALVEGTNVQTCEELGIIAGVFDASAGTITVTVPMEMVAAKKGSKIAPAASIFGGSIAAIPAAFLSSGSFPMDTLTILKTFTVPKK